jgi:hypothetical protein
MGFYLRLIAAGFFIAANWAEPSFSLSVHLVLTGSTLLGFAVSQAIAENP